MGKKSEVIEKLFNYCINKNNYVFDNDIVKEISKQCDFSNPFDVTKLDTKEKLPELLIDKDYCVIHLGNGRHRFIKGISTIYHNFEPIQKADTIIWKYTKSLLNNYNDSESNILSVANNQRILHDFLFNSDLECADLPIDNRPKTYFPHRTKKTFEYLLNGEIIKIYNQQIEIDLTIEYNGIIGLFEAKNGEPSNFNVYQLFYPYLYYMLSGLNYSKIKCIYLVRTKRKGISEIKLWEYEFEYNKLDSIKYIKSKKYLLENTQGV